MFLHLLGAGSTPTEPVVRASSGRSTATTSHRGRNVDHSAGETRATYGYLAYGSNDTEAFIGIDTRQPDQQEVEESYNPYRFNHKRFDAASGSYDPGLNRFTSRDLYLGARADMGLTADGFTGNRYAFTAGNPISRIELDGHKFCASADSSKCYDSQGTKIGDWSSEADSGGSGDSAPAPSTTSKSGDVNMAGCMGFSYGCPVGEPQDITPTGTRCSMASACFQEAPLAIQPTAPGMPANATMPTPPFR